MNISDLSYFQSCSNTTAIQGGITISLSASSGSLGPSIGESSSISTQVIMSRVLSGDDSGANGIVSIDVFGTGGNLTVSGLTDGDEVRFNRADSNVNISVSPINVEPLILNFDTPLEVERSTI